MKKKLTLSMNEAVIEAAKEFAQEKGKSLSALIENYLLSIVTPKTKEKPPLEERMAKYKVRAEIEALAGSLKMPEGFDAEKAKEEYLRAKYKL